MKWFLNFLLGLFMGFLVEGVVTTHRILTHYIPHTIVFVGIVILFTLLINELREVSDEVNTNIK